MNSEIETQRENKETPWLKVPGEKSIDSSRFKNYKHQVHCLFNSKNWEDKYIISRYEKGSIEPWN